MFELLVTGLFLFGGMVILPMVYGVALLICNPVPLRRKNRAKDGAEKKCGWK